MLMCDPHEECLFIPHQQATSALNIIYSLSWPANWQRNKVKAALVDFHARPNAHLTYNGTKDRRLVAARLHGYNDFKGEKPADSGLIGVGCMLNC
eukprot:1145840-Pelagomonas_calceolata.AAC.1